MIFSDAQIFNSFLKIRRFVGYSSFLYYLGNVTVYNVHDLSTLPGLLKNLVYVSARGLMMSSSFDFAVRTGRAINLLGRHSILAAWGGGKWFK
jgi:hypothetical protein